MNTVELVVASALVLFFSAFIYTSFLNYQDHGSIHGRICIGNRLYEEIPNGNFTDRIPVMDPQGAQIICQ